MTPPRPVPCPQTLHERPRGSPAPVRRDRRRGTALLAALAASLLLLALPGQAQDGSCSEPGMNAQCSEFGAIVMVDQYDIRGEAIQVPVTIVLNTAYEDQSARWMLFTARSADVQGTPVTIDLDGFTSAYGDVVTTRVEQPNPGEINLWVDTLDAPLETPLSLDLTVGATQRGAFRLETLVMAFDRAYSPIQDSEGKDASLYSFTMLGVNGATSSGSDEGFLERTVPAPGAPALVGAVAVAAAIALLRRRSA